MIYVGIFLVVLGIVSIFINVFNKRKLFNIKATQTFKAKDINDLCECVKEEIGPGSFNKVLEVKGFIRSDNPLIAELSGQECVYYSMKVTREYEEKYTAYENNRPVTRTRRGSEIISSNTQSVHFYVEDDTGKILVNPNDASIDGIKSVDRFEPHTSNTGTLRFGNFSLPISISSGSRTLGYRYVEEIIPINRRVYVLGEASDSSGELMVQKPKDKKETFLISLRSEEEIIASTEKIVKLSLIGAILGLSIGIILIVISIINNDF